MYLIVREAERLQLPAIDHQNIPLENKSQVPWNLTTNTIVMNVHVAYLLTELSIQQLGGRYTNTSFFFFTSFYAETYDSHYKTGFTNDLEI